nr:amino acid adenylation domain-containing protein [Micromonospora sp. HNM0581]
MSSAQQRVWFSYRWEGPSSTYNVPVSVRITGLLDRPALLAALDDVMRRHESLRTRFEEVGGEVVQLVTPPDAYHLEVVHTGTEDALAEAARRPFVLESESPVRLILAELSPQSHVLGLVMHHIICDGWSLDVLLDDLATAYAARTAGRTPEWPQEPVGYGAYVAWQRELLDSVGAPQLAYWKARLAGLPAELPLPYDRPRPPVADTHGDRVRFTVAADVTAKLSALARQHNATVFMVLQAAVAALLHRLGAGADIPLGTPTAGRTEEALARTVGLFVNSQVTRADVSGDPSFTELLGRVREDVLEGLSRQDVPFERIVEAVQPARSTARHPLFQVGVELAAEAPRCPLPGLDVTVALPDMDVSKFDLSLVFHVGTEIAGTVEYATALFDRSTAEALAERTHHLLAAVAADPDRPVSSVEILTSAELAALESWAGPQVELPSKTVLDMFEERVRLIPGAVALVAGEREFTFAGLNAWVNRCAHGLLAAGAGPDIPVACMLPRTAEAIAFWLAVGKSGSVYVPIDPALPEERIRTVLSGSGIRLVVTTADFAAKADPGDGTVTTILDHRQDGRSEADPTDTDRPEPLRLDHAAYIIYTSGSTGEPKGVTVLHRALINEWIFHTGVTFPSPRHPEERRRVLLTAALAFDTSWEGVLAMIAGHELHLAAESIRRDPAQIVRYVADQGIDQLDVTPSFGQQLLAEGLLNLPRPPAVLMLGGEAVPDALWEECLRAPATKVFNYYGPSEFCIEASGCALDQHPRSTIGRPLPNTRILVLDEHLNRVPVGVQGELYLSGANLGRGYAGQAARTAERFVANPYGAPGERMYRSGDLARWTAEGFLIFGGRSDDQVKLRGFRIELGEIQRRIQEHPQVGEAAVVLREDQPGEKRIVAYVVGEAGGAELRPWLEARLPEYMVPSAFVTLDALPLTRNAKLDRAALPEPDFAPLATGRQPVTKVEQQVAALFAEVLKVDAITLDDNFFDMGGHSLLATRLVNRIRGVLRKDIDLMALFDVPTVSGVVANLTDLPADEARPRLGGAAR